MGGDVSRATFREENHYSGVRLQQGRVQLDSDWNEQLDIQAHRDETTVRDAVGLCGAPRPGPGEFANFQIRAADQDIEIAPGRIYVDGVLCENGRAAAGSDQPNLPESSSIVLFADGTTHELPAPAGTYLAYLDVWQREITAIEDPSIREDALGGPDTATRTKTVWQVKLLRVGDETATADCSTAFPAWDELVSGATGKLRARSQPAEDTGDDPCIVPPGGGYRRLENQLYRVEVHDGGQPGEATFKWSRENGAVVAAWLAQDRDNLIVDSAGRDAHLGFAAGQWVELTDDTRELQGRPGVLVRLAGVEDRLLTIDPDTAPVPVDRGDFPVNPKVRRWDLPETATGAPAVETPAADDGYLPLEDGVEVRFEPGEYRSGDYWLIPARTLKADVEWPQGSGQPQALAPHGVRHHFCRLALLRADASGNLSLMPRGDCRPLFPPLTRLTSFFYVGGDGQQASPSAPVGPRLRQPLRVGVANGQWPVVGALITFAAAQEASAAPHPNGTVELADGGQSGPSLTVATGADGTAECYWRLGQLAADRSNLAQRVTATLLGPAGDAMHLPIYFGASLSVAGEVGYTPGGACRNLEGATTVQEAIDELCKTGDNAQGIRIREVRTIDPDTPLVNDGTLPVPLMIEGLRVVCDTPADERSLAGKPTCFITLEMPYPFNDVDMELWSTGAVIGYQPLTLRGEVRVEDESVLWVPADGEIKRWLVESLFERMARRELGDRILARLTLKGNFIWAAEDAGLYLDGDSFGRPSDSGNTELEMPSGDSRRGGDFEMWFWLAPESVGLKSLTISQPAVVTGGERLRGTATLSGRAGSGGTRVTLSSDNAAVTVPPTVTVPPGELSAGFDLETIPVTTPQSATVTARLEGSADQTATLSVQPPRLAEIRLSADRPVGIGAAPGTLALNGRAPAGGIDVALSSGNPQVATVPASVRIAAGQSGASFTANAVSPGQATLTGTLGESRAVTLRVLPRISSVQLRASAVVRGGTVGGAIILSSAVPFEVRLALASTNPRVATVPASIIVPANTQTANFAVATSALGVVGITANLEGSESRSATLSVLPKITALALSPATVVGGEDSQGRITLESSPPMTVGVALSSSNASAATVPASVSVTTGSNTATFTIPTSFVTQTRSVVIRAFYGGVESPVEDESQQTANLTVQREKFGKPEKDAKDKTEGPLGPIGPLEPILFDPAIRGALLSERAFIRPEERRPPGGSALEPPEG